MILTFPSSSVVSMILLSGYSHILKTGTGYFYGMIAGFHRKGFFSLAVTSKKASPESSISRLFPVKRFGNDSLESEFSHTCVPSARKISLTCPFEASIVFCSA
jgi:hypothetical protein